MERRAVHVREEICELREKVTSEIIYLDGVFSAAIEKQDSHLKEVEKAIEKSDVSHQLQNLTVKMEEVRNILTDLTDHVSHKQYFDLFSAGWT